jgi:hypothetical protein
MVLGMDGTRFRDLHFQSAHNGPLTAGRVFEFGLDSRLYVANGGFGGFVTEAVAVAFLACESCPAGDWENETLRVEVLFRCVAFSDGPRHLVFAATGDEMQGYMNYPDLPVLAAMLAKVAELCPSP